MHHYLTSLSVKCPSPRRLISSRYPFIFSSRIFHLDRRRTRAAGSRPHDGLRPHLPRDFVQRDFLFAVAEPAAVAGLSRRRFSPSTLQRTVQNQSASHGRPRVQPLSFSQGLAPQLDFELIDACVCKLPCLGPVHFLISFQFVRLGRFRHSSFHLA